MSRTTSGVMAECSRGWGGGGGKIYMVDGLWLDDFVRVVGT